MRVSPQISLIDEVVAGEAIPLRPDEISDYDPLLEAIGSARIVLFAQGSRSKRHSPWNRFVAWMMRECSGRCPSIC
ncbi:MAG TPA: hypothetical protein VMM38_01095 [Aridibacter sp.]|nr:hypothetical protein [Aridibacter sp.]